MKIERGRGVTAPTSTKRAAPAQGPAFTVEPEAVQRAAGAAQTTPVPPVDALLALQGEDQPGQQRARQARRGRDVLDALERLERGLLVGRAPGALKAELERLQQLSEPSGEPELDALLREVDTRLAVELAKLERLAGKS